MLEDQNPDQNPEPSHAQGMELLSQLQSLLMHLMPLIRLYWEPNHVWRALTGKCLLLAAQVRRSTKTSSTSLCNRRITHVVRSVYFLGPMAHLTTLLNT